MAAVLTSMEEREEFLADVRYRLEQAQATSVSPRVLAVGARRLVPIRLLRSVLSVVPCIPVLSQCSARSVRARHTPRLPSSRPVQPRGLLRHSLFRALTLKIIFSFVRVTSDSVVPPNMCYLLLVSIVVVNSICSPVVRVRV